MRRRVDHLFRSVLCASALALLACGGGNQNQQSPAQSQAPAPASSGGGAPGAPPQIGQTPELDSIALFGGGMLALSIYSVRDAAYALEVA